jgi:hypothetical protein
MRTAIKFIAIAVVVAIADPTLAQTLETRGMHEKGARDKSDGNLHRDHHDGRDHRDGNRHNMHGRPHFNGGPVIYWNYPFYYVAPGRVYWYYCPSAQTYYPYVEYCPDAWVPIQVR